MAYSFVPNPELPHERPQIKDLDEKLKVEAKGFLAWMVQGSVKYLRDGLKVPQKVMDWTKEQRVNSDDIGEFIDDWCITEPYQDNPSSYKLKISSSDIYDAFSLWYSRFKDKKKGISAKRFAEMLTKKQICYKRSNGSWRIGIDLNSEGWSELDKSREERGR